LYAIILGAHGIYVYSSISGLNIFELAEVASGGPLSHKLFLSIGVPSWFQSSVCWMSIRGVQSWVIPAIIVVAGSFLFITGWRIFTHNPRVRTNIQRRRLSIVLVDLPIVVW
jgi:hypothetical protein